MTRLREVSRYRDQSQRPPGALARQGMRVGSLWAGRETQWLLIVTLCYVVAQPLLFHMNRYLVYDETVYTSEVYPGQTPTGFSPTRARGLVWLISPVSLFGPPVEVIRYYVLLVFGAMFFVAFRAWVPVLRMRAVGAAALFATGWLTLFYGTEIFPNLPVALGDIAAAGYLAQHLSYRLDERTRRRALVKAAVAVAVVAVFRPTEAAFLTIGLLVVAVTRNWRLLVARWGLLGAGLVIGWVPWVIEAYLRYGGFLTRMRSASSNVESGFHPINIWYQLTLTDGPLEGTTDKIAPTLGYLWWALLVIGVVLAAIRVVRYKDRTAAVAAFGGLASATQYLLFTAVVQARFLLPAYGLLTVCLVAALPPLPAGRAARACAWAVIAAFFAVFAGWNVRIAQSIENQQYVAAEQTAILAQAFKKLIPNGPCYFVSEFGYPEIMWVSHCTGAIFLTTQNTVQLPVSPGPNPVYVLSVTPPGKLAVQPVPGTVRKIQENGLPYVWWLFVVRNDLVQVNHHLYTR